MRALTVRLLSLVLVVVPVWGAPSASSGCVNGAIPGTTCQAQCGTDHPGGDYASLPAATFQVCANACNNDAQCITAQWDNIRKYCYLKRSLSKATTSSRVDSVICRGCPTTDFQVQVILSSGYIRYLYDTGNGGRGQVFAYDGSRTLWSLNGTDLISRVANNVNNNLILHTDPGGITVSDYKDNPYVYDYRPVQVYLTPSGDQCIVTMRAYQGSYPFVYSNYTGGGVALFLQSTSTSQYFPVTFRAVRV